MRTATPSVDYDATFGRYMAALLEGDARVISLIVDDLIAAQTPFNHIYRDFIQRGMYEVGLLWERNQIPVSVEHLAATATVVVLSEQYLKLQSTRENCPVAVIACVQNELHDVGTMVVANICESAGWKTIVLGANTPTKDMLTYIQKRARMPDLLALSVTLPATRMALIENLAAVTEAFPKLHVLIGGQALEGSAEAVQFREELLAQYPSVRYMPTLDALEAYLRSHSSQPEL